MISQLLQEIKDRADKATPGPFAAYEKFPQSIAREFEILQPGGGVLFRSTSYGRMKEDAEFIAHSREDVPRLVKALELALEVLADCRCDSPRSCPSCGQQREIERILKGEGK